MWQKERLLGIVLSALPAHVRYVAWVDCDVIFADPQWHERTRRLLQDYLVVQPFRRVVYLPREATRRLVQSDDSFAEVLRPGPGDAGDDDVGANEGRSTDECGCPDGHPSRPSFLDLFERVGDKIVHVDLDRRFEPEPDSGRYNIMARPAHGYAWAARVDAIRQIGLYDRCVLGGGDNIFAYGLVGQYEEIIANHRSVGWDSYGGGARCREWAGQAAELCRGQLKCGDGTIVHLYHGSLQDRQYRSRIDTFMRFGVDIERDILAEPGAPWSWMRDTSELNSCFLDYLRNRNEDG